MIALISLFIPPLIFLHVREKLSDKPNGLYQNIVIYIISVLALNSIMLFILYFGFDSKKELFYKLNQYNDFALKYICLSVFLAVFGAYAEKYARKNVEICVLKPDIVGKFIHWRFVIGIYGILLFFMNFVRIFDNNFWGDEAFTINLMQHTIPEIISITAADVHPPLYYLIVKAVTAVLGQAGLVFHIVSLIPCFITLVFAITAVWDTFGKEVSVLLMTMAGLSGNAIRFNVEVRMYSWGALFLLLSFYELYSILENEKNKAYILFVIFSLAAAYTHYYCVISVAFFYIAIIVITIFAKRLSIKKVLVACLCTVAGYLPWFSIMYHSLASRSDNFWITNIPSFKDSIKYVLSLPFNMYIFLAAAFIIAILYETGILKIERNTAGKIIVTFSFHNIYYSNIFLLIITGILSITGTIGFGILISVLIRPFYVFRYVYPVSAIVWMLVGIILSRLRGKSIYTAIVTICLLSVFLPGYQKTYIGEKHANEKLASTLKATVDEIGNGDIILTDVEHMSWQIAKYYYPDASSVDISLSEIPELNHNVIYWLILSEAGNQEADAISKQIQKQGFSCELIVDNGILGTHIVYIYRISSIV